MDNDWDPLSWIWDAIDWIYDRIDTIWDYAYDNISALWTDIRDLRSYLNEVWEDVDSLIENIPVLISDAKTDVQNLIQRDLIDPLSDALDQAVDDLWSAKDILETGISDIWSAIDEIYRFIDNISDTIDNRITGARDLIISWVVDSFISILERVLNQEKGS